MIKIMLYVLCLALFSYTALIYGSEAILLLVFGGVFFLMLAYAFLVLQLFLTKAEIVAPIPMVEQGSEVEIAVVVKRRWNFPAAKIKVMCVCKNTVSGRRKKIDFSGVAAAGKEAELSYQVRGKHCGGMEYKLRKIRIYDLTGFFYVTKWCRQKAVLNVMPQICETSVIVTERARNFMGEAEVYDDKKAGPDASEIFDIRPFRDGDKIQSIHWKMSAKTEELMMKENSLPRGCPVVLLFNMTDKEQGIDSILTVAATISCALVEQKCAHYIAWYDSTEGDVTRMRVDQEEDLYQFLLEYYMEEKKYSRGQKRRLPERVAVDRMYQEKYRMETVVQQILVDRNLELNVGGRAHWKLNGRKLAEELKDVEIVV